MSPFCLFSSVRRADRDIPALPAVAAEFATDSVLCLNSDLTNLRRRNLSLDFFSHKTLILGVIVNVNPHLGSQDLFYFHGEKEVREKAAGGISLETIPPASAFESIQPSACSCQNHNLPATTPRCLASGRTSVCWALSTISHLSFFFAFWACLGE